MWATGVRRIIAVSASPVATITSSSRPQLMLACLEDDETIGKVVRVAF